MDNQLLSKDFFYSISYLFYAVSYADKAMVTEEKREIVKYIRKDWAVSNTRFDSEELMYETMRTLIRETVTSEVALKKFQDYYIANQSLFSKDLKNKLLKACHSICNVSAGKNKSELIILAKIHKLFTPRDVKI